MLPGVSTMMAIKGAAEENERSQNAAEEYAQDLDDELQETLYELSYQRETMTIEEMKKFEKP